MQPKYSCRFDSSFQMLREYVCGLRILTEQPFYEEYIKCEMYSIKWSRYYLVEVPHDRRVRTTNRIQSFSLVVDVLHDVQVLREVEGVLHAITSKNNR